MTYNERKGQRLWFNEWKEKGSNLSIIIFLNYFLIKKERSPNLHWGGGPFPFQNHMQQEVTTKIYI